LGDPRAGDKSNGGNKQLNSILSEGNTDGIGKINLVGGAYMNLLIFVIATR
jgi:hypothetical protein